MIKHVMYLTMLSLCEEQIVHKQDNYVCARGSLHINKHRYETADTINMMFFLTRCGMLQETAIKL